MSTRKIERAAPWEGSQPAPLIATPIEGGGLLAGTYEPLIELAAGGMGRVVIGRRIGASGFERLVVIKQVHRHLLDKDVAVFFRDEARIASLIHHANVVPVIDVVEGTGELLLVMEYVESVSLSLLLRSGELIAPEIASRILLDMLAGLHAAHELKNPEGELLEVVHRDVSPQNVIVGVDGVSRLIDFGVAKAKHRLTETESGDVKGKLGYMSPEQANGQPIDRRSDIFACGVMLYESLTGKRLFAAEHPVDTLRRLLSGVPPETEEVAGEARMIVKRALARDSSGRPESALVLAEMLEAAIPPASHRKVADAVTQRCGAILAARRELLDRSRRPSVTPSPPGPPPSLDVPTLPRTPASDPKVDDDATTQQASFAGSARSIAPGPARTRRALVGLLALVALLGGGAIFLKSAVRLRQTVEPSASAKAQASAAPPPPVSVQPSAVASTPPVVTTTTRDADAGAKPTGKNVRAPATTAPPPRPTGKPDELQGDPYGGGR